ncbi:MarR family transcriptional regulator [Undibacterium sp.]|uniref:MarR family transcriptional regulator n=1 Tax=Undibacterium sp. TaxID=1914977 RepID=UPI0027303FFA|nr:MarR family transcriptional regulator [Undibacterium sp.]MDP1980504.1 MarR family transcriptional regulator [Undibacterium sp.]
MNEPKKKPDYFNTVWFNAMHAETKATSISAVAVKMGVSRPTLSVFINGLGAYGSGHASPANMEIRYRKAFEQLTCPHTGAMVGAVHCRESALRTAPSHNPIQMMQWQACQSCQHKPAPVQEADQPKAKAKRPTVCQADTDTEPAQQAGIIDKVTLPLPEVGGPQIAETEAT